MIFFGNCHREQERVTRKGIGDYEMARQEVGYKIVCAACGYGIYRGRDGAKVSAHAFTSFRDAAGGPNKWI
jgi:hypothetical protein